MNSVYDLTRLKSIPKNDRDPLSHPQGKFGPGVRVLTAVLIGILTIGAVTMVSFF